MRYHKTCKSVAGCHMRPKVGVTEFGKFIRGWSLWLLRSTLVSRLRQKMICKEWGTHEI